MSKKMMKDKYLSIRFEKWLYVIRNLDRLDKVPSHVREEIFEKFFEMAEVSKLNMEQARLYEDSLKVYRDLKNSLETALEDGIEIGRAEGRAKGIEIGEQRGELKGKLETAKKLLAMGLNMEQAAEATGLSESEIRAL